MLFPVEIYFFHFQISELPLVICVEFRAYELSLLPFMLICLFLSMFSSYVGKCVGYIFMDISSDITRSQISRQAVWSSGSQTLSATLWKYSLSLRCMSCFVDVSACTGLQNSTFCLVVAFCNCFSCLKEKFIDEGSELSVSSY